MKSKRSLTITTAIIFTSLFMSQALFAYDYGLNELPLQNELIGKWTLSKAICENDPNAKLPKEVTEKVAFAKKARAARYFYKDGSFSIITASKKWVAFSKKKPCVGAASGTYYIDENQKTLQTVIKNAGFKGCALQHNYAKLAGKIVNWAMGGAPIDFEYEVVEGEKKKYYLHLMAARSADPDASVCNEGDRVIYIYRKVR